MSKLSNAREILDMVKGPCRGFCIDRVGCADCFTTREECGAEDTSLSSNQWRFRRKDLAEQYIRTWGNRIKLPGLLLKLISGKKARIFYYSIRESRLARAEAAEKRGFAKWNGCLKDESAAFLWGIASERLTAEHEVRLEKIAAARRRTAGILRWLTGGRHD